MLYPIYSPQCLLLPLLLSAKMLLPQRLTYPLPFIPGKVPLWPIRMSLHMHPNLSKFHENISFLGAHNSTELVRMLQETNPVDVRVYMERDWFIYFMELASAIVEWWQVQNLQGRPVDWRPREELMLQYVSKSSMRLNSLIFRDFSLLLVKAYPCYHRGWSVLHKICWFHFNLN